MYKIVEFITGSTDQFIIDGYGSLDVVGTTINVYDRLVNDQLGYLNYNGIQLETVVNYEATLGILNGVNAPVDPNDILEDNLFKENFIVVIGSSNFAITEIDGTTILMDGPGTDFTTTGTAVTYDILKYEKIEAIVPERDSPSTPGNSFPFLDRRGNEVFEIDIETGTPMMMMANLKNAGDDDIIDPVMQQESIGFSVEWADTEGEK